MMQFPLPVIGLCACSGTGKTTLLTRLIPLLIKSKLRIGIVKHAHHQFDIDHPGKDSYELRHAGAAQVAVASKNRIAWIREFDDNKAEPVLADALAALDTEHLDLVIAEGFKGEDFPKIELHRPSLGKPLMYTQDKNIIALASDEPMMLTSAPRLLDLNDIDEIAEFIISCIENHDSETDANPAVKRVSREHVNR